MARTPANLHRIPEKPMILTRLLRRLLSARPSHENSMFQLPRETDPAVVARLPR